MKPDQPEDAEIHRRDDRGRRSPRSRRLLSRCRKPSNGPVASKRTRDLPDLTKCHACGFRVDACNGKSRIQTLYSEWRIVLLCKRCFSRVESSQICTCCFKETFKKDSFRCCRCNRCVHKVCFSRYKAVPPWSYSCSEMDFSLCVDCWVPKPMASKRETLRSSSCSKNSGVFEGGTSRVLNRWDSTDSSEGVMKNANCVMDKKIDAEARAKDMAVRKVVAAKRAIQLASNASDLAPDRGDSGLRECSCDDNVVDDTELAFQLHRAMNSSPRISKNLSVLNSRCLTVPKICDHDGDLLHSENACFLKKLEVSTNTKIDKNTEISTSEPSADVSIHLADFSTSMDYSRPQFKVYVRTRLKDGKCARKWKFSGDRENLEARLNEGEGSCSTKLMNSSVDDNSMNSGCRSCHNQDKSTLSKLENSEKPDRYSIKYQRKFGSK